MPYSPGGIRVNPNGQTAVVTFTLPGGGTPVAYSSQSGAGTGSLPATITTTTDFWFAERTTVTVSALVNGAQQATSSGTTSAVDLSGGGLAGLTVAPPSIATGTYQPIDSRDTSITTFTAGMLVSSGSAVYKINTTHAAPFDSTKATQLGGTSVAHGATASTARPTGITGPVTWTGSVSPTNAVAGDTWWDTTTDPYTQKVRGSSTFSTVGAGTYVAIADAVPLSNSTPAPLGDVGAASTDPTAARAGHVHPKDGLVSTTALPGWARTFRKKSGQYYSGFGIAGASGIVVDVGREYCAPFLVAPNVDGTGVTFDQLAVIVTTANASGVFRLGIRSDDGSGYPSLSGLIVSTGDLSTAATGTITGSISQTLAGGLYWLCFLQTVAGAAQYRLLGNSLHGLLPTTVGNYRSGFYNGTTNTNTSLPTSGGTTYLADGQTMPTVLARAA